MVTLSTGDPSTLGTYKKIAVIFGQKAVDFIQTKIDEAKTVKKRKLLLMNLRCYFYYHHF